jgi:hypothetical protein|tara:strand:- start:509 stop:919 length:411 start_codon:yes stop_codon:yes gene_type:complete
MQRKIILTSEGHRLVEAAVKEDRKIGAIKACRLHGKIFPPDDTKAQPNSVGLKEAKHAIEHAYFNDPAESRGFTPCAVLGAGFKIKKLTVEIAGEGEVELDIEEMQMRFLQELESLGLAQVQRLLELTEYIKEWQN